MAARDYYDILGVGRKASADEIKSSYRKLARQYHPDVNKAADAQRQFTEVQQAYDVLSDEKKRGMYDRFGHAAFESGAAEQASARAASSGGQHYSWSNVGGGVGGGDPSAMGFDPDDLGSIFESMFGAGPPRGGGSGSRRKSHSKRKSAEPPPPSTADLHVDFMVAAKGGVQSVRLGEGKEARTIDVTIPAGCESGTQMRVRSTDGRTGDVLLTVLPMPHRHFRRGEHHETGKGLDLFIDVPITIAEATLGGQITVPTLAGTVDLAVPEGSPSGRRLRLRGLGITDAQGRKGDLYAVLKIIPPPSATLSPLEVAALKEIAARGGSCRPW
ncbi:MAG: DnaJ C-terminal domain-containing protein [Phycisphaerae bacterium]|jgi:curved DNA-binding protein